MREPDDADKPWPRLVCWSFVVCVSLALWGALILAIMWVIE